MSFDVPITENVSIKQTPYNIQKLPIDMGRSGRTGRQGGDGGRDGRDGKERGKAEGGKRVERVEGDGAPAS